jgi:drug/metabolite transporter (DMT)-like permease
VPARSPTVGVVHAVLAIGLAFASAIAYAVSAALQHHEASQQDAQGLSLVKALVRRPRWCAAVAASLVGALLHLGALGAGPLVLVQPLGLTALVFALPLGARLNRERVTPRSWFGAACVVVGLPAVLGMVPHHRPGPPRPGVLSYPTAVLVVAVLVVLAASAAVLLGRRRPRRSSVLYAVGAALCFGLASGVVRALWLGRAEPLVVAAGLAAMGSGVVLAQHAYRSGGLGAPLAVLNLVDPLTGAAIGVLVLGESLVTDPLRLCLGVVGVAVTSVGVVLLSAAAARADVPVGIPIEPLDRTGTP